MSKSSVRLIFVGGGERAVRFNLLSTNMEADVSKTRDTLDRNQEGDLLQGINKPHRVLPPRASFPPQGLGTREPRRLLLGDSATDSQPFGALREWAMTALPCLGGQAKHGWGHLGRRQICSEFFKTT